MTSQSSQSGTGRIEILDLARGVALIAMAIFHFNFDLELFGVKPQGYINQAHWVYFARSIAASFLTLVGIGLYLAHHRNMVWNGFWYRLAKIGAAALLITVATWFATPEIFIFFGILHNIAVSSILGLLFVRLPWFVSLIAGLFFLLSRPYLRTEILDHPFWLWTGLTSYNPNSSDYVPMFPWFGWVLMGIAAASLASKTGLTAKLRQVELQSQISSGLQFLGRHSLLFYLLHQPIMIGLLVGFLKIVS